jgi:hypothetical protein
VDSLIEKRRSLKKKLHVCTIEQSELVRKTENCKVNQTKIHFFLRSKELQKFNKTFFFFQVVSQYFSCFNQSDEQLLM